MKKSIKLLLCILIVVMLHLILLTNIDNKSNPATDDILLMLVNYEHKIPENYNPQLIEYDGYKISNYIKDDLNNMLTDARKDGYQIEISSAYRSYQEQKEIYDDKYNSYIEIGMKKADAKYLTEKEVAVPGYSEHETGLALDLSVMGDSSDKEKVWHYLKENSYKYGFINRYSESKTDITKIKYEPWHYRYVGKKHAKEIYVNDICLEEYQR